MSFDEMYGLGWVAALAIFLIGLIVILNRRPKSETPAKKSGDNGPAPVGSRFPPTQIPPPPPPPYSIFADTHKAHLEFLQGLGKMVWEHSRHEDTQGDPLFWLGQMLAIENSVPVEVPEGCENGEGGYKNTIERNKRRYLTKEEAFDRIRATADSYRSFMSMRDRERRSLCLKGTRP